LVLSRRIAIAEKNALVRRAILRLLHTFDDVEVVSLRASPPPALVIADMDLTGPATPLPGVPTILLTIHDGPELHEAARQSLAIAVLCKTRLHDELSPAILRLFSLGEL
jgi:DNA-binding NarL/FixJ family response regulator